MFSKPPFHNDSSYVQMQILIIFNFRSSSQSTPKRVSFRKFIENGKAKTAVYLPFQKYIQNYKQKKKANGYSPIKGPIQITSKLRASLPAEVVSGK